MGLEMIQSWTIRAQKKPQPDGMEQREYRILINPACRLAGNVDFRSNLNRKSHIVNGCS